MIPISCEICGSNENLQLHHDSYDPPLVRTLCIDCHYKIHGHGVGSPQGHDRKGKLKQEMDNFSKSWDDGLNYEELQKKYGISVVTVYNWSKILDKPRRNNVFDKNNNISLSFKISKSQLSVMDKIVDKIYINRDEFIRSAVSEKIQNDNFIHTSKLYKEKI